MNLRTAKRVLLLSVLLLTALLSVTHLHVVKKIYHALSLKAEYGTAYVVEGDRLAIVYFDVDFRSPPVVTLSKSALANGTEYTVSEVTDEYFVIELSERPSYDLTINWHAGESPATVRQFVDDVAGMPASFSAVFEDIDYEVFYTGYENYLPVELFIPGWEIEERDTLFAFKSKILTNLKREYKSMFECGWIKKKLSRIAGQKNHCIYEQRSENAAKWRDVEQEDWLVEYSRSGLRLYQKRSSDNQVDQLIERLGLLLKSSKFSDISIHNNQMLDFVEMVSREQPVKNMTLIHFDTHSDMYVTSDPRMYKPTEQIADFINVLMRDERVDEVYWVLPDWTKSDQYKELYWETDFLGSDAIIYGEVYLEGPSQATFHIDKNTGSLLIGDISGYTDATVWREVKVNKVTVDELPNFENATNVILEFDADYFSNSGEDTSLHPAFNPSKEGLVRKLSDVVETLLEKSLEPALFYMCLSPGYVTVEDQSDIASYVGSALLNNNQRDLLSSYLHNVESGIDRQAVNKLRSDTVGRIVFKSMVFDAQNWPGDQAVRIDKDDREYQFLLNNIIANLEVSQYEAESLIIKMDKLDGYVNDEVNLVQFEYFQAKEKDLSVSTHEKRRGDFVIPSK